MKKIMTTCLALATLGTLWAQEKETEISEVTVNGRFLELPMRKVNENITVITADEIASTPAASIEEMLATVTGFDIRRRGGNGVQADIAIRGSSFEQVLILINGVRMNDSQTGHNSMSIPVDLSSVQKIEVIKGPAARRFGQNAYAGVVNIVTKPGGEDAVTVSASGGDFSTYTLGAAATLSTGKVSHLIQANSSSSEGYRYNTDYKIDNVYYQNEYALANSKFRLQAGFQQKKFGANGFYSSPKATEQYEETQASVVSLGWERPSEKLNLNAEVYWRRGQDMYLFNRAKPEIYRNMHIGNNVGGELNASYKSSLGTTGVGAEFRGEYLASNNLGHHDRLLSQVFLEHHFLFLQDRLQIAPGISWAHYNTVGSFFYPGLEVGFDLNKNHKIYANIARVNRIPTFTDLYYESQTEAGNPDLKPERALATEFGYRYQHKAFTAKASFFTRDSENSIDWIKEKEDDRWKAENIGAITTKGFEIELSHALRGFVKSYSLGYTYLDSRATDPENLISRYVLENLRHQFVAKLENRLFKNLTNQLVYRYNERVSSGNHQLLDDKITYDFGRGNVFLLVNNITNTAYTETFGVPMPGRWFHIGFNYKISL